MCLVADGRSFSTTYKWQMHTRVRSHVRTYPYAQYGSEYFFFPTSTWERYISKNCWGDKKSYTRPWPRPGCSVPDYTGSNRIGRRYSVCWRGQLGDTVYSRGERIEEEMRWDWDVWWGANGYDGQTDRQTDGQTQTDRQMREQANKLDNYLDFVCTHSIAHAYR